MHLVPKIY